ncbi:MAG: hypothetical protein Q9218_002294 [Villophora microphyllina]
MSGFADLRAKFENKSNITPPPSRGRSPAGRENVSGSSSGRKIRTSFISVERSGQMAPSISHEESTGSNEGQNNTAVGEKEAKANQDGQHQEVSHMNGDVGIPTTSKDSNGLANGSIEPKKGTATDAVNPDKPITAGGDDAHPMQPSDPKDESAVSGGAALAPKGESLGALLKGSDFEPVEKRSPTKISSPKKSPKKPTAATLPSTPTRKTKGSEKSTHTKFKARDSPKINRSPKSKPESDRLSTISKPQAPPATEPSGTEPATSQPTAPEPTAPEPTDVSPAAAEKSTENPKTPTSPAATKPQLRQPLQKTASPRQSLQPRNGSQATDKDHRKTHQEKPSRTSMGTKPAQPMTSGNAKTSSSAQSRVPKKSTMSSPTSTKPKPRSPTRPVRLPSSATAPTAASAAKTGAESQANPSDPTKFSTLNKPAGTKGPSKLTQPTAPHLRTRAPRSSLPAPTVETKPKPKPKPRTSIASTQAGGGDFLARMMRPTQSSASKTHEKAEQKTPPKKRVSSRPKRISEEGDKEAEKKIVEAETALKNQEPEEEKEEPNHTEPEAGEGNVAPGETEIKEPDSRHSNSGAPEPVPLNEV